MFYSQYPSAFTGPHGTISLSARVMLNGQQVETHLLDADAETKTAFVRIPGRCNLAVPFSNILNVALKYSNGEIIENFGRPTTTRPESIAYIEGVQYA